MKQKIIKILRYIATGLLLVIIIAMLFPTWTPKIPGENSISELKKVSINGTKLEVMIRGKDRSNPVIIYVHGGPSCPEIPYAKKFQDLLENDFVVVNYDERGSGKSYHFFEDYSDLSAETHVADLLELTDYIKEYLGQDKVILIGHSYGTYVGTRAAALAPEKFSAYIGVGQMSDLLESERDGLSFCISEAESAENEEDLAYLKSIEKAVSKGEKLTPRSYVRKYGGAARLINDNAESTKGLFLCTEYNLLDVIRYNLGVSKNQMQLIKEAYDEPLPEIVTKLDLPFYFVLGKYDFMTSASAAKNYFEKIEKSAIKEFIVYDSSAHYPHFEEEDMFYEWMCDTFK